jgi:hypothetical protein
VPQAAKARQVRKTAMTGRMEISLRIIRVRKRAVPKEVSVAYAATMAA